MDVFAFVFFSFNRRYVLRWVLAGLVLFVPVINFLSLGYLWRTSGLSMVGGMGLPTWERKGELFKAGARMVYIVILYEALPCFLFSLGFFLSSPGNFVMNAFGWVMQALSAVAFVGCSLFLPFALCTFVEGSELMEAFEFERIAHAVRGVLVRYIVGCVVAGCGLYVAFRLRAVPYLGIFVVSILVFYVLLVSTYYFTELFRTTKFRRSNNLFDLE